jgi:hypothetical protein
LKRSGKIQVNGAVIGGEVVDTDMVIWPPVSGQTSNWLKWPVAIIGKWAMKLMNDANLHCQHICGGDCVEVFDAITGQNTNLPWEPLQ